MLEWSSRTMLGAVAPLWAAAVLGATAGCSTIPGDVRDAEVGQAIVGGSLDVRHPAVVGLLGSHGLCTATMVAVGDDGIGVALTAAHCVEDWPEAIVEGDDLDAPAVIEHPIVDVAVHPAFDGGLYDFALVRFAGAAPDTPFIVPLSPGEDELAPGTRLEFVGYGRSSDMATRSRQSVTASVTRVDVTIVEYSQLTGGPCQGDSGGPALVVTEAGERVAAVTSYGDPSCSSYGASGRVSGVLDGFIRPFLDGLQRSPGRDCAACGSVSTSETGACANERAACAADAECALYAGCVDACRDQAGCLADCRVRFADALDLYLPVEQCVCARGCPNECRDSPRCPGPACGVRSSWLSCQACLERTCCSAATRCADDETCADCAAGDETSCLAAGPTAELSSCLADGCERECLGTLLDRPPAGATSATGGAAPATCSKRPAPSGAFPHAWFLVALVAVARARRRPHARRRCDAQLGQARLTVRSQRARPEATGGG